MKKLLIILASATILLSCTACGNNAELDALRKDIEDLKQQINTLNAVSLSPTQAPQDAAERKQEYTFSAGYYEVGVDIPAGKYDIKHISGSGYCYVATKDDNWVMHEYMASEPDEIMKDNYITHYNNVILENGLKIEISKTLNVAFISK